MCGDLHHVWELGIIFWVFYNVRGFVQCVGVLYHLLGLVHVFIVRGLHNVLFLEPSESYQELGSQ